MSDDILKQVAEVYRKIRNTFRFLHGNLFDFDPAVNAVPVEELREVDQYILIKLNKLIDKVKKLMMITNLRLSIMPSTTSVRLSLALSISILQKMWYTLSMRIIQTAAKMQTVFYETLMALVKLTAPILPHTADELWSHLSFVEEPSVQLTDMPEGVAVPQAEATEVKFDRFMEVRDDVLKALEIARNEKVIGRSLEASVTLYATEEVKNLLASIKEDVK